MKRRGAAVAALAGLVLWASPAPAIELRIEPSDDAAARGIAREIEAFVADLERRGFTLDAGAPVAIGPADDGERYRIVLRDVVVGFPQQGVLNIGAADVAVRPHQAGAGGPTTREGGFDQTLDARNVVLSLAGPEPVAGISVARASVQSTAAPNGDGTMRLGQTLQFSGLAVEGMDRRFVPATGEVAWGAGRVPLARVLGEIADFAWPTDGDPADAMALLPLLLRPMIDAGSTVGLDALDLEGPSLGAAIEAPMRYDLGEGAFATDGNRIVVRGLGTLANALGENVAANQSALQVVLVLMAIGRREVAGGEAVYVYDLATDASGRLTVNGRLLAIAP